MTLKCQSIFWPVYRPSSTGIGGGWGPVPGVRGQGVFHNAKKSEKKATRYEGLMCAVNGTCVARQFWHKTFEHWTLFLLIKMQSLLFFFPQRKVKGRDCWSQVEFASMTDCISKRNIRRNTQGSVHPSGHTGTGRGSTHSTSNKPSSVSQHITLRLID